MLFFKPAFIPIEGIYDGYGGVKNIIKDDNTKLIESYYKNSIENIANK